MSAHSVTCILYWGRLGPCVRYFVLKFAVYLEYGLWLWVDRPWFHLQQILSLCISYLSIIEVRVSLLDYRS